MIVSLLPFLEVWHKNICTAYWKQNKFHRIVLVKER